MSKVRYDIGESKEFFRPGPCKEAAYRRIGSVSAKNIAREQKM